MRYARYIALMNLMLLMTAGSALAKGEARFHNARLSGMESNGYRMSPDIRPMALEASEVNIAEMKRKGPAKARPVNMLAESLAEKVIPSAVSRTPQKKSHKAQRRQKRKPFRIQGGKRQSLALVLSIFLGVIGIHRFYLGYTGIALIQMLTLGGLFVWFIVDAFRIGFGKLMPTRGPYTYHMGNGEGDEEE